MPKNKRLHFKDIDGIKGLLSLPIVVFCSLSIYHLQGEDAGLIAHIESYLYGLSQNTIDFFFLTSSFLVISQGLREYKYYQTFSFKNYLARRILRLLPIFVIGLLFAFLWHPWLVKVLELRSLAPISMLGYIFFIPNYTTIFTGEQAIYLGVICLIYMLIQQYIFWGLVLRFLHKYMHFISVMLIMIGIGCRTAYVFLEKEYMFDTLSYFVPMGIGALLASSIRQDNTIVHRLKKIGKTSVLGIYAIGVIFLLLSQFILGDTIFVGIIPLILGIFFSFVVIEQTFGKNSFLKFRTLKIFLKLGKISYGLIVYNAIIAVLFMIAFESMDYDLNSPLLLLAVMFTSFIISVMIANISYKIVEKPLSRIKKDFKRA